MILLTCLSLGLVLSLPSSALLEAELQEYEGHHENAQTLYRQILKEKPADFAARLGLARTSRELGERDQSNEDIRILIQDLTDQIHIDEDPSPYLVLRARAHRLLGNHQNSLNDLRRAYELNPENQKLRRELRIAKIELQMAHD